MGITDRIKSMFGTSTNNSDMYDGTIEVIDSMLFPRNIHPSLKLEKRKDLIFPSRKEVVPFDIEYCLKNFIFITTKSDTYESTFIFFKNGTGISYDRWYCKFENVPEFTMVYVDSTDEHSSYYEKYDNDKGYYPHYKFTSKQYDYIKEKATEQVEDLLRNNVRYAVINKEEFLIGFGKYETIGDYVAFLTHPDIGEKFPYWNKSLRRWNYCDAIITDKGKVITNYNESNYNDRLDAKYSGSLKNLKDLGYKNKDDVYDEESKTFKRALNSLDYKIKLIRLFRDRSKNIISELDKFIGDDHRQLVEILSTTYCYSNNIEINTEIRNKINKCRDAIKNEEDEIRESIKDCYSRLVHCYKYEDLEKLENDINELKFNKIRNLDYYKEKVIEYLKE